MSIRKTLLAAIVRDPKTIDELVAETLLTKTQVSGNMALIVKDALAIREADDGRLVYHITDAGRDWVKLHQGEDDSSEQPQPEESIELSSATQSSQPAVEEKTPATLPPEQSPPVVQTGGGDPLNVSPSALESQIGGNHYKGMKIQPVEYIHQNGIGFIEGNVIKYVSRWRGKNGIEDLKKARHFIDLLIEIETIPKECTPDPSISRLIHASNNIRVLLDDGTISAAFTNNHQESISKTVEAFDALEHALSQI